MTAHQSHGREVVDEIGRDWYPSGTDWLVMKVWIVVMKRVIMPPRIKESFRTRTRRTSVYLEPPRTRLATRIKVPRMMMTKKKPTSILNAPVKYAKTEEEAKHQYKTEWAVTCNADFVNRVGCPVDAYYGGTYSFEDDEGDAQGSAAMGAGSINKQPSSLDSASTCAETYSFHLGTNPIPIDYMNEPNTSPVFSIGTYLTHRFVFRLHSDPTVVVDEYIVSPTVVRDCPEREVKSPKAAAGVRDAIAVEGQVTNGEEDEEGKIGIVAIDALSCRISEPNFIFNVSDDLLTSVLNATQFNGRKIGRIYGASE